MQGWVPTSRQKAVSKPSSNTHLHNLQSNRACKDETFLQRDHSGSRNCSMGSIIIDYLLIVNVQDTAIVRTGLESIDPIFGNIYQSRKI